MIEYFGKWDSLEAVTLSMRLRNILCSSNLLTFYKCLSFIFSKGWIEEDSQWIIQINIFQKLIDRLEKKDLKLEPLEEEVLEKMQDLIMEGKAPLYSSLNMGYLRHLTQTFLSFKYKEFRGRCGSNIVMVLYQHVMIVQHQMSVTEEKVEEFFLALKQYVKSASAQGGCLHVYIQKLPSDFYFIVYEFWENSNAWNSHLQRNYSKVFQRSNMDFLKTPELITTMLVPGKYQLFTLFFFVPWERFY
ncbi:hypothetical protein Nmel_001894 [Mimus melanotis]